ncbi:putative glycosyltransferase 6 domain-containing protein 1 [Nannospalax galili]|uniref:putative glycosyltransferase 6 domain-containing protein 1 n=1 Tax=Nannospalax galili TaxID=1026970 RepID=UPI0004ED4661|nr:putative glycosyltransferase 6 domain-containing protein 1 [Nannospalax galili]
MVNRKLSSRDHQEEQLQRSDWFKPRNRLDVITTTNWLAPVIWEGTFNREALEKFYRKQNITVGLAVFAFDRLIDEYLDLFLQSASKFFMPGHKVIFYIIVDRHLQLPDIKHSPLQSFQILMSGSERWWNHLDLVRMKILGDYIQQHIKDEVDFLFSMTANLIFQNEFGVETLGKSVAQLHFWWYFQNTTDFPYERRAQSTAYIPFELGDFYYAGTIFGGVPLQVLSVVQEYIRNVIWDIENGINSTYEKYLNKYFFLNKPTKLLSPEYCWNPVFRIPRQVWRVKVAEHPTASW